MAVYFLRFERPAGDPLRPRMSARYYVGYCPDEDVPRRIKMHRTGIWDGQGSGHHACLPTWFRKQGIAFRTVRVLWGAGREDERRIKRSGNYHRWDPSRSGRLWRPKWLRLRDDAQRKAA